MDNGTQFSLTLVRLPEGGYLVQDPYRPDDLCMQHLACTTIDEALKFMRDKILPIGPTAGSTADVSSPMTTERNDG